MVYEPVSQFILFQMPSWSRCIFHHWRTNLSRLNLEIHCYKIFPNSSKCVCCPRILSLNIDLDISGLISCHSEAYFCASVPCHKWEMPGRLQRLLTGGDMVSHHWKGSMLPCPGVLEKFKRTPYLCSKSLFSSVKDINIANHFCSTNLISKCYREFTELVFCSSEICSSYHFPEWMKHGDIRLYRLLPKLFPIMRCHQGFPRWGGL